MVVGRLGTQPGRGVALRVEIDQQTVRFDRVKLLGENTELDLSGTVDLPNERVAVTARGVANLAVLQGFYRDVRSSGRVELIAEVRGAVSNPRVDGFAVITDGRVRHPSLPHAFERINGRVSFGSRGVWFDDVRAEGLKGVVVAGEQDAVEFIIRHGERHGGFLLWEAIGLSRQYTRSRPLRQAAGGRKPQFP
jgi:autotransporter translocation and assembly factor TamB